MSWRVVVVSSRAKLEYKLGYLVIRYTDDVRKVFLPDISVLLIENTGCSITAALLQKLWENKTCIIFTDEVNTSPALTYIIYQMHKHKKSDKITFIGAINPYSTTKVLARHISRIGIVQNIPKTSYKVHLYKQITDVSIHSLFMEDENNLS